MEGRQKKEKGTPEMEYRFSFLGQAKCWPCSESRGWGEGIWFADLSSKKGFCGQVGGGVAVGQLGSFYLVLLATERREGRAGQVGR